MNVKFRTKCVTIMVTILLFSVTSLLKAQTVTVSGTVYETDGTTAMIGANVLQKGVAKGTITDLNGKFTIKVSGANPVLVFRSVGYNTVEVPVKGKRVMTVTMTESTVSLQGVVVTALGITREEKSLGYSVSKITNEDLTSSVSGNWLNNLSGKVAGLDMMNAGAGPLGSMRVTLRGDQSLNYGNNGALFVVDGVPITSGSGGTGGGANYANADAPVDFGNGASDINPDDVESVTVLKGAAATALYGSLAANGAIIITTKGGKDYKGFGVTVNSSLTLDQASFWPDFQKVYGPGSDMGLNEFCFWNLTAEQAPDGVATSRNWSRYAFGEKFDGSKMRYQYMSKDWDNNTYTKTPFTYADDWYTGFFQTGATWQNTVTVSGGDGKGNSARASITDTRNDWITPNTGYKSDAIALAFDVKLNKQMKLSSRINFIHKSSDNLPVSGYSAASPVYSLVWGNTNNPIRAFKDEYFQGRFNEENYKNTSGADGKSLVLPMSDSYNPYRTAYQELNKLDKNRVYGNLQLSIDITKNLNLNVRSALDMDNEFRSQRRPFYTADYPTGFYREQDMSTYRINNDFLLRYTNNTWLDKRLSFTGSFGGNTMQYKYYRQQVTVSNLAMDGVYNINNVAIGSYAVPSNYRSSKIVNSFYGFVNLGWDNTFYLDITARNDWSSTLSRGHWSYFYPSVSGSVLLDKVFHFDKSAKWIDMLKYRLSWANVGNDTDPYNLDRYYSASSYTGSYTINGTVRNRDIKPENVASWETGIEGKLFKGRISFDLTAYHNSTTNQIVTVAVDQITGATGRVINAGEIVNKGLELSMTVIPVRNRNFTWSIDMNWSKNWNKLVSLQDGWDPATPFQTDMGTTIGNRVYVYSFVGHSMDYLYGRTYQRAPKGAYYTDDNGNKVDCSGMKLITSDGYPVLDASATANTLGKVDPDWRAGMTQRFKYKNLSLSMNFTAQYGGHCYSVTNFALGYQGKLTSTLPGRYDGLVVKGVVATTTEGVYTLNKTITPNIQNYYNAYVFNRNNAEDNTFNTSFLKLKEVRLDYTLPKRLCMKTKFLKEAGLGFYATNLFCLTSFPQYDPEAGVLNDGEIHRGIEPMVYPMTRSYGFNVKLSF